MRRYLELAVSLVSLAFLGLLERAELRVHPVPAGPRVRALQVALAVSLAFQVTVERSQVFLVRVEQAVPREPVGLAERQELRVPAGSLGKTAY